MNAAQMRMRLLAAAAPIPGTEEGRTAGHTGQPYIPCRTISPRPASSPWEQEQAHNPHKAFFYDKQDENCAHQRITDGKADHQSTLGKLIRQGNQ